VKKFIKSIIPYFDKLILLLLFKHYKVEYSKDFKTCGIPRLSVKGTARMKIGTNFKMNNGGMYNPIGRQQRCLFFIRGKLTIGNNVGISDSAFVCMDGITIEDNVLIGGNTAIYDTDFHSLDYKNRTSIVEDKSNIKTAKVHIKKNAFIGAHTTILKGVTIGQNSIVGACSVVAKDIPENEIWAGNPACFIRSL
jgi:acetyltransferase-like isoleucine patch superfamily enzyme